MGAAAARLGCAGCRDWPDRPLRPLRERDLPFRARYFVHIRGALLHACRRSRLFLGTQRSLRLPAFARGGWQLLPERGNAGTSGWPVAVRGPVPALRNYSWRTGCARLFPGLRLRSEVRLAGPAAWLALPPKASAALGNARASPSPCCRQQPHTFDYSMRGIPALHNIAGGGGRLARDERSAGPAPEPAPGGGLLPSCSRASRAELAVALASQRRHGHQHSLTLTGRPSVATAAFAHARVRRRRLGCLARAANAH